ncbi:MAG TPA: HAMP domain-containing sensor histidine kinase [Pseudonocardia sp.]|nr:HAMP domain-containing sensor histidine kinase [Pseudonocardia sp.]
MTLSTRLSLRTQLIIGVLVLVAVAIGAFSGLTYLALRAFLVGRMDAQLATTPARLVTEICLGTRGDAPAPPIPLLIAQLDAGGHPGAPCPRAGYVRPLHLSEEDARRLARHPRVPMEVDGPDGPVRAVAFEPVTGRPGGPGQDGGGPAGSNEPGRGPAGPAGVRAGRPDRPDPGAPAAGSGGLEVVALSLEDVRATLDRLVVLELAIGALALVLAGSVGALGVGRGLRPLTRVTTTARAVAGEVSAGTVGGGGLERRVPEGSPDTEVGRLAEAFNTMLTAVQTEVAGRQDSEQRMRQFLADASHELRTPLTSLRGYAELIGMRERRDGIERDPESADALRRISEEGARMSRLVEDLLVLARSDQSGTRRDEPMDLGELAADSAADLRAAHPGRDIKVDAEAGSAVRGDPDQLRRVLVNLLANAAVHTSGDIRVGVTRADGQVRLVVADDGPGLTPQQAAHVFDRFWRADSARTRAKGGSGLGLAIVDTLVSGHGGSIDFDTSPAAGTTVTVTLPAAG